MNYLPEHGVGAGRLAGRQAGRQAAGRQQAAGRRAGSPELLTHGLGCLRGRAGDVGLALPACPEPRAQKVSRLHLIVYCCHLEVITLWIKFDFILHLVP